MRGWRALAAALICASPTVLADAGETLLVGPIALEGSTLGAGLDSLLLNETSSLASLRLVAPRLVVHAFEITYAKTPGLRLSATNESSTYEITDAEVVLAEGGAHTGWLGAYGEPSSRLVAASPTGAPLVIAASLQSVLANGAGVEEDVPRPGSQVFLRSRSGPHFALATSGEIVVEGRVMLKLRGPDLELTARENTTRIATGEEEDAATVTARWLFLEADDARLTLACACEARALVSTPARASWRALEGFAAQATLDDGWTEHAVAQRTMRVEGRFESDLLATSAPAIAASLEGDLTRTSMPIARSGGPAALWIGGALTLLVVGAALVVGVRRRRGSALTAEDHADLAARALEARDPAQAAAWLGRARALAPGSERLAIDEAYAREQMGDLDGALALYEEAGARGSSGEADLLRARLLVRTGRLDEARPALARAFERDPWLVLSFDEDGSFDEVREDPVLARVADRARRAVDEAGTGARG